MASALIGGMIANAKPPPALAIVEPLVATRTTCAARGGVPLHAEFARKVDARRRRLAQATHRFRACAALRPHREPVRLCPLPPNGIADFRAGWPLPADRAPRCENTAMIGAGIAASSRRLPSTRRGRAAAESVLAGAGEVIWSRAKRWLDAVRAFRAAGRRTCSIPLSAEQGVASWASAGYARKFGMQRVMAPSACGPLDR